MPLGSSGAIRASRAYVELYGDKKQLEEDLDDAEGEIEGWAGRVAAVGNQATNLIVAGALAIGSAFTTAGEKSVAAINTVRDAGQATYAAISDTAQATKEGIEDTGNSLLRMGGMLGALGGSISALLGGALKVFTDMGSDIQELSAKTGIAVEDLSTFRFAADTAGSSLSSVTNSIQSLNDNLVATDRNGRDATAALASIGLSGEKIKALDPATQFRVIADRLASVQDKAKRAALAQDIFGSSAAGILPILDKGAGALADLEERARELGLQMKGSDAKAASELKGALEELWASVKMVSYVVGAPLAEGMTRLVKMATPLVANLVKWLDTNRDLILSADMLGTILTTAGAIIAGVGSVLTTIATGMGYIGAGIAALLTPIGLATAAVAGLGYYITFHTEAGAVAIDWLTSKFFELKNDATQAVEAVSNALVAGDIESAAQVVWTGLKLEWTKGVQFLQQKWEELRPGLVNGAVDAASGIAHAFVGAVHFIADLFEGLMSAVDAMWMELLQRWVTGLATLGEWMGVSKEQNESAQGAAKVFARAWLNRPNREKNKRDNAKLAEDRDKSIDDDAKDLRANYGGPTQEIPDQIAAAQKAFDDAVAHALGAKARGKPPGSTVDPKDVEAGADELGKKATQSKGIGFEDVRTTEGAKAVLSAIRGGKNDVDTKQLDKLTRIADRADRSLKEQQKTNALLVTGADDVRGFGGTA